MSSWWHVSSWWYPNTVTNPKSYFMYVYFSPEGRISSNTWFWFWLYLFIIWFYFFIPVTTLTYGDFMVNCAGIDDYWEIENSVYDSCYEDYQSEWSSRVNLSLSVWILLLYPFWVVSLKRYHDIGQGYQRIILCILLSVLWGLGVLIYMYDMTRPSSSGYGPKSVKAKMHGKGPIVSFGDIWSFESKEIQTAIKWENQKGFFEAITIYKNLKRLGDVNRVESSHIKYKRDLFVSKLSELKSKGIDCTNLESSSSNLNKALTDYFNIKDEQ
jgi:uncharacterized membrane protein YhaH (DUF805 family)